MQVLLSIRPEYAERILSGEKRYEYRRKIPVRKPATVVIYATSPVMRLIGEFDVISILEDTPKSLWKRTGKHSGVSAEFYDNYFSGRKKAYAIKVGRVKRYEPPLEPKEALESFCPPQFFRYLKQ